MTLAEIIIASCLAMIVAGAIMAFSIMTESRVRSGRAQVLFTATARIGTARMESLVQKAKLVSVRADGNSFYLINPDNSINLIYYRDADNNPSTLADNAIWFDPNPDVAGDESILIRYVTRWQDIPIFTAGNGAVVMCFHVGDSAAVGASDRFSGLGYQGVRVRWAAKPRNVGNIWTSEGYE